MRNKLQDNTLVSVIDSPDFNTTRESFAKMEHSAGGMHTARIRGADATWSNDLGTELSTARSGWAPLSQPGTAPVASTMTSREAMAPPLSPNFMLFNFKDCHVGFDKELAKQFDLEGSTDRDVQDLLPRLRVDTDLPYTKSKRKSQPHAEQTKFAKTTTGWNPASTLGVDSRDFETNTVQTHDISVLDASRDQQFTDKLEKKLNQTD